MADELTGKGLERRNRSQNGVLFRNLSEETEEYHDKPLSQLPVTRPTFESSTSGHIPGTLRANQSVQRSRLRLESNIKMDLKK
jgi:hypothetical protein